MNFKTSGKGAFQNLKEVMETEGAIVARNRGKEEEMFRGGGDQMSWVLNIAVVTQLSASVKIHRTVH